MRNSKIDYAIKKARISKRYKNIEVLNFSTYLNILARYLNEEYCNCDVEQTKQEVYEDIQYINKDYANLANLRGRYFQLIAAREIVNDREFIKNILEKVKNNGINEKEIMYTNNYNDNKETVVKQVWKGYLEVDKESLRTLEKYVENTKNKINTKGRLNSIEKRIKLFVGDPENIVNENIKYQIPIMEEELKQEIISIMEFLGRFFKKFNLFERYITKHSSNMIGINCPELKYELSTGEYDLDKIGLEELFTKEVLQKFDVDQLMVLNMFYQNRFSKEIASIGEAIFAIDTLDLWEKAKEEGKIELNAQQISALKDKINCLDNISSRLFEEIINQEMSKKEELQCDFKEVNISDKLERINRHSGKDYKFIFDNKLPESENRLEKDLPLYKQIANIRDNVYIIRENAFSTFLYSLIKQKSSKNFGVIKNEYVDGKLVNKLDSKYILIGVDYEGFNMPVKFHANKENLIDTLKTSIGNSIIQEYEGGEDFIVGEELISTNLLMPIQKPHKKAINEIYKQSKGKKNEKFISHIRFLKEPGIGKFPKHLMQAKNTPKGVKYVIKPKKYIDLETRKEYVLDENNNFIQHGGEIEFE